MYYKGINGCRKEKTMKKVMQNTIKYIAVFIVTLFILLVLLVLAAKIPRNMIAQNIREYNPNVFGILRDVENIDKIYTYRHKYADEVLLNIIWCLDSNEPLKSVLEAKYYSPEVAELMKAFIKNYERIELSERIIPYNFADFVKEEHEGNVQYLRYWHGSISILRPLLVLFNIQEIYIINAVVLLILTIVLLALLLKQKLKEVIIAGTIGIIMCQPWIVPFCFEYFWTFLIMLISSIIILILEKKQKKPDILFIITGMVTCYLDFLSTELITVLIPLILVLVVRYKNESITKFSQGIKYTIIYLAEWGLAYIGMWFAKWIIASIVLGINPFEDVMDKAMIRINGEKNWSALIIPLNLRALFPLNSQTGITIMKIISIILIIIEIILVRKKEFKKMWISIILLFIAIIPYLRYLILLNHSYVHLSFTYRMQLATIISVILAMIYSWDKNIIKNIIEKVSRSRTVKDETRQIKTMVKK